MCRLSYQHFWDTVSLLDQVDIDHFPILGEYGKKIAFCQLVCQPTSKDVGRVLESRVPRP